MSELLTNPSPEQELPNAPQEALLEDVKPEDAVDPNQPTLDFEVAAAAAEEEQQQKDWEKLANIPNASQMTTTDIAEMLGVTYTEAMKIKGEGTMAVYKQQAIDALEKKKWDAEAPAREEAARKAEAAAKEAADKQWAEDHKWDIERQEARDKKLAAEAEAVAAREAEIAAAKAENARLTAEATEATRKSAEDLIRTTNEHAAALKAAQEAVDRRYGVLVMNNGGSIGVKRRGIEDDLHKQAELDVATNQLYETLVKENGGTEAIEANPQIKERLNTLARDAAAQRAKDGTISPYPVAPILPEAPELPKLVEVPKPLAPRLRNLIDSAPAPSTAEETKAIAEQNTNEWQAGRETYRADNPELAANPGQRAERVAASNRASTQETQNALIAFHRKAAERINQAAAKEAAHDEAVAEDKRRDSEQVAAEQAAIQAEEDKQWLIGLADVQDPASVSAEDIQTIMQVSPEEAQRIWDANEFTDIVQDARHELADVHGMTEYAEVESRQEMNGYWDDAGEKFYLQDSNGTIVDVWDEKADDWQSSLTGNEHTEDTGTRAPAPTPINITPDSSVTAGERRQTFGQKLRSRAARRLGAVVAGLSVVGAGMYGVNTNSPDANTTAATLTAPANQGVDHSALIASPTRSTEATAIPRSLIAPEASNGNSPTADSPERTPAPTATKVSSVKRNPDGTYDVVLEEGSSIWNGIENVARSAGVANPSNAEIAASKNQTLKNTGLSEEQARRTTQPGLARVNLSPELIARMNRDNS